MEPKTLSASSALVFEQCPARYKAEFIDRVSDLEERAGQLGSACHGALEFWVKGNWHTKAWGTYGERENALKVVWETIYPDYFSTREAFDEGWTLLKNWVNRTDFVGREVQSCEVKENFPLPTSRGPLPITYIWDRCDKIPTETGFEIEVVDYKTVIRPIQSRELKNLIQPRVYALAAAIKFREAEAIWVTYDLLRYDSVSVKFTREDHKVTWNYLKTLAERIYESDGTEEILNPQCKYCVRKSSCLSLIHHSESGGILKNTDNFALLVDQRAEVKYAADALYATLKELDELILSIAENEELFQFRTESTDLKLSASNRRNIDSDRVAYILGPQIMLKYGKIRLQDIDELLKGDDLTPEQKKKIKLYINREYGAIKVETKPRKNFEQDEI